MDPISKVNQFLTNWIPISSGLTRPEEIRNTIKDFKWFTGITSYEDAIKCLDDVKKISEGDDPKIEKINLLIRTFQRSEKFSNLFKYLGSWNRGEGTPILWLREVYEISGTANKEDLKKYLNEARKEILKRQESSLDFQIVEFAEALNLDIEWTL